MRIILTAIAFVALTISASAQASRAPYPYAADGTLRHSRASMSPAENFLCRKDHARLDRVAAEPAADAQARLNEAIAGGGTLIVAEIGEIGCASCAHAIEQAFASRSDVAAAFVNVRERKVYIVAAADAELTDRTIRKIVARRGHETAAIERLE